MLKLRVVAVGSIKESFYREAVEEYKKRLGRWAKVEIVEVPEASSAENPDLKRTLESEGLLRGFKGKTVLLDVKGKKVTSEGLAEILDQSALAGDSELTFVIGGSNGVAQSVKSKADLVLSFGEITLPHQLFRVVLLEQLYRAESILHGSPYHK